eukprot:GHVH01009413.1.p1 GENE.GHVH01009413.1~~GHVH01009413.1.p1  ORF type:complete len:917 (+),score=91.89 GHVH01009413.1:111-2861(+)
MTSTIGTATKAHALDDVACGHQTGTSEEEGEISEETKADDSVNLPHAANHQYASQEHDTTMVNHSKDRMSGWLIDNRLPLSRPRQQPAFYGPNDVIDEYSNMPIDGRMPIHPPVYALQRGLSPPELAYHAAISRNQHLHRQYPASEYSGSMHHFSGDMFLHHHPDYLTTTPPDKPRGHQRVQCSPPLAQRIKTPVSNWDPKQPFNEQLEDYRSIRNRFQVTNRYLMLRGLSDAFFEVVEPERAEMVAKWVSGYYTRDQKVVDMAQRHNVMPSEIKLYELSEGKVLHVAFKARQTAKQATSNLQTWLRKVHSYIKPVNPCESNTEESEQVEFCLNLRFEWVGPLQASNTLWIGNIKESILGRPRATNDNTGMDLLTSPLLVDFLRVFRFFGCIKQYRPMFPLGCIFIAYENTDDAIAARNRLFGWCVGDQGDCCLNIDFSASAEIEGNGSRVNIDLRHPCSKLEPLSPMICGSAPMPDVPDLETKFPSSVEDVSRPHSGTRGLLPAGSHSEVLESKVSRVRQLTLHLRSDTYFIQLLRSHGFNKEEIDVQLNLVDEPSRQKKSLRSDNTSDGGDFQRRQRRSYCRGDEKRPREERSYSPPINNDFRRSRDTGSDVIAQRPELDRSKSSSRTSSCDRQWKSSVHKKRHRTASYLVEHNPSSGRVKREDEDLNKTSTTTESHDRKVPSSDNRQFKQRQQVEQTAKNSSRRSTTEREKKNKTRSGNSPPPVEEHCKEATNAEPPEKRRDEATAATATPVSLDELIKASSTSATISIYKQSSFCMSASAVLLRHDGPEAVMPKDVINLHSRAALSRLSSRLTLPGCRASYWWISKDSITDVQKPVFFNLIDYLISKDRLGMCDNNTMIEGKDLNSYYVIPPRIKFLQPLQLPLQVALNENCKGELPKGCFICVVLGEQREE